MAVALNTFKEAIRAKWILIYAIIFFLLAINIPTLIALLSRELAVDYLQVYLSDLVTITFPFLPLFALPIGSLSIVDERTSGSLQYVLSNPISKESYLLGRFGGFMLATTIGIVIGYGGAAFVTYGSNFSGYIGVGVSIMIGVLLNFIMLAMAMTISTATRSQLTALGTSLFFWFLFVVLSSIGFLGTVVSLISGPAQALPLILLNPVESARIFAVLQFNAGYDQLGTTGLIVKSVLGDSSSLVLLGVLVTWAVGLFGAFYAIFKLQDAS